MSSDLASFSPGDLVRVRQRTWLVEDVEREEDASPLVRLACVDDDAQGQRLSVAWDAELDGEVIPGGRSALQTTKKPDDPRTFAAYLHALRWGCVTSTNPALFQMQLLDHARKHCGNSIDYPPGWQNELLGVMVAVKRAT